MLNVVISSHKIQSDVGFVLASRRLVAINVKVHIDVHCLDSGGQGGQEEQRRSKSLDEIHPEEVDRVAAIQRVLWK